MDPEGSVTRWIAQLKDGDRKLAAAALWRASFHRLVALAQGSRAQCVADDDREGQTNAAVAARLGCGLSTVVPRALLLHS